MADRSFHFIPGHRADLFACVDRLEADHYVFDLEDAVPQAHKTAAREGLARFLAGRTAGNFFLRTHSPSAAEFACDVALLRTLPGLGIVLPKIADDGALNELVRCLDYSNRRIVGLIESFAGVGAMEEIVDRAPLDLYGLGLGMEDLLSASCFTETQLTQLVAYLQCRLAVTCLARGIVPIDGICTEVNDIDVITAHCLKGRSAGLAGKFTIHPRQIPVVNRVFWPETEARAWAEQIAKHAGPTTETGYQRVGGVLITPPKVKKANRILSQLRETEHG